METVNFTRRQRAARILTLLVLSPVITELLFGSTHVSMFYLLVPQVCIYGGAALIIHTFTRQRGWNAVLVLGIAFAVALECILLQTSVSPPFQELLFGAASNQNYLGAFGVNWAYLLWALGYESVWGVVLPIQLTGLIFFDHRDEPWIGRWGIAVTVVLFLVMSYGLWYSFTQVGMLPGLAYEAPASLVLAALAVIVFLVVFTFWASSSLRTQTRTARPVPRPWLTGLIAFGLSLPWFFLAILPYLLPETIPFSIGIMIGLLWAAGTYLLVRRWSSGAAWQDAHRLAFCSGVLVASMLAGFLINASTLSPFDLAGKFILNGIAILLLAVLARQVRKRTNDPV